MKVRQSENDHIPWFGPEVGSAEARNIQDVLDSGYLNDGAVTRRFESEVADLVGVRHCVAVTSGTVAISAALMGLGIGSGDEVIVPDLTFIATANAVRMTGASVRLVDIEPGRFALDPERVRRAMGPRTRAVVPVDVNGRGCDYEALETICREHGLRMVCDAAEALGSRYGGRHLGSFGDAGCFSFSANKTVTCGQGGMIATNDTDLFHRLLELKDQGRRVQGTGGDDMHPVLGFNFKLTNIQAAIGIAQMNRLEARLQHARRRNRWYLDGLSDCDGVDASRLEGEDGEALQWADILVPDRNAVAEALDRHKIGCRAFWHPLHTQGPYRAAGNEGFGNAMDVSRRGLWLPSHFGLTEAEAARTCAVIRDTVRAA